MYEQIWVPTEPIVVQSYSYNVFKFVMLHSVLADTGFYWFWHVSLILFAKPSVSLAMCYLETWALFSEHTSCVLLFTWLATVVTFKYLLNCFLFVYMFIHTVSIMYVAEIILIWIVAQILKSTLCPLSVSYLTCQPGVSSKLILINMGKY